MLKRITTVLSIILFSAPAFGGDHVRNGGGSAEKNFALALQQLSRYIDLALVAKNPSFSPQEIRILNGIKNALPQETRNQDLLQFRSESDERGFFMLDGAVRVAKTGSDIGDTIFINRDLIYAKKEGKWQALNIPDCVSILIHELGHHQGDESHTILDLIGTKVQSVLERQMTINEFDPNLTVIGDNLKSIIDYPSLTSVDLSSATDRRFDSRLYIADSFGTYDVTEQFAAGIQAIGNQEGQGANRLNGQSCWSSNFDRSEKSGWKFSQFHLSSPRWTYASTITNGMFLFVIKTALSVECVDRRGSRIVDPGLDALYLVIAKVEDGKTRFAFIDAPELRDRMVLINDDDEYKMAAALKVIFQAIFH